LCEEGVEKWLLGVSNPPGMEGCVNSCPLGWALAFEDAGVDDEDGVRPLISFLFKGVEGRGSLLQPVVSIPSDQMIL
jgi:hypothetical protein